MSLVSESDVDVGRQLLSIVEKKEAPRDTTGRFASEAPAPEIEPGEIAEDAPAASTEAPEETQQDTADEADIDASPDDPAVEAQPSIDPPAGLTADETEVFRNSPPEVQKAWARREQERQREFRRWQNQQAEANKQFAAQAQAIQQERQALAAKMQEYGSSIETEFQQKFGNVKDPTELLNDPMKLLEYQALQAKVAMYRQQRHAIEQQANAEREARFAEFRQAENEKLRVALNLTDDKAAADFESKVVDFIARDLSEDGWDEGRIVSAIREAPAVMLRMAHDAMRWRQAEAKRKAAEKAAAPPPKVQRPGVKTDASPAQERQKQAFQNLRKTGRVEDAAAYFRNII